MQFDNNGVGVNILSLGLINGLLEEGSVESEDLEEEPVRVILFKHVLVLLGLQDQRAAEVKSHLVQSQAVVREHSQPRLLLLIVHSETGVCPQVVLSYSKNQEFILELEKGGLRQLS